MDSNEQQLLKNVFKHLDKEKTGLLGVKELSKPINKLGKKIPKETLQDMIWEVDSDGDGYITVDDMIKIFARVRENPLSPEPTRLLNVFEFLMHDTDNNGTITVEQCVLILSRRFSREITQADIHHFMVDISAQADPTTSPITFQEFYRQIEIAKMLRLDLFGNEALHGSADGVENLMKFARTTPKEINSINQFLHVRLQKAVKKGNVELIANISFLLDTITDFLHKSNDMDGLYVVVATKMFLEYLSVRTDPQTFPNIIPTIMHFSSPLFLCLDRIPTSRSLSCFCRDIIQLLLKPKLDKLSLNKSIVVKRTITDSIRLSIGFNNPFDSITSTKSGNLPQSPDELIQCISTSIPHSFITFTINHIVSLIKANLNNSNSSTIFDGERLSNSQKLDIICSTMDDHLNSTTRTPSSPLQTQFALYSFYQLFERENVLLVLLTRMSHSFTTRLASSIPSLLVSGLNDLVDLAFRLILLVEAYENILKVKFDESQSEKSELIQIGKSHSTQPLQPLSNQKKGDVEMGEASLSADSTHLTAAFFQSALATIRSTAAEFLHHYQTLFVTFASLQSAHPPVLLNFYAPFLTRLQSVVSSRNSPQPPNPRTSLSLTAQSPLPLNNPAATQPPTEETETPVNNRSNATEYPTHELIRKSVIETNVINATVQFYFRVMLGVSSALNFHFFSPPHPAIISTFRQDAATRRSSIFHNPTLNDSFASAENERHINLINSVISLLSPFLFHISLPQRCLTHHPSLSPSSPATSHSLCPSMSLLCIRLLNVLITSSPPKRPFFSPSSLSLGPAENDMNTCSSFSALPLHIGVRSPQTSEHSSVSSHHPSTFPLLPPAPSPPLIAPFATLFAVSFAELSPHDSTISSFTSQVHSILSCLFAMLLAPSSYHCTCRDDRPAGHTDDSPFKAIAARLSAHSDVVRTVFWTVLALLSEFGVDLIPHLLLFSFELQKMSIRSLDSASNSNTPHPADHQSSTTSSVDLPTTAVSALWSQLTVETNQHILADAILSFTTVSLLILMIARWLEMDTLKQDCLNFFDSTICLMQTHLAKFSADFSSSNLSELVFGSLAQICFGSESEAVKADMQKLFEERIKLQNKNESEQSPQEVIIQVDTPSNNEALEPTTQPATPTHSDSTQQMIEKGENEERTASPSTEQTAEQTDHSKREPEQIVSTTSIPIFSLACFLRLFTVASPPATTTSPFADNADSVPSTARVLEGIQTSLKTLSFVPHVPIPPEMVHSLSNQTLVALIATLSSSQTPSLTQHAPHSKLGVSRPFHTFNNAATHSHPFLTFMTQPDSIPTILSSSSHSFLSTFNQPQSSVELELEAPSPLNQLKTLTDVFFCDS
ncbi:putative outer dynein arm-docking complex subunit 3 [Blattamonas nauphoetae]|uniref:Outer dynein arm-docking complex subunit 3 n=1 Tax=Blattamonas nauphoetae TaxID=2049346 RepID=A0ABQ9X1J3_9EUKA|nr:putative outer dynein arm-docking complex subunit 3 [Blattamonas nauphoetae]